MHEDLDAATDCPVVYLPSFLPFVLLSAVGYTHGGTQMRNIWSLSPEGMDTVDHPGHVLLVIDVRGLGEEGLAGRSASYCPWGLLSSTTERVYLSHLWCMLPFRLGSLSVIVWRVRPK